MTYYKATRPDGMSFHAGLNGERVLYAVGATVAIPERRRKAVLCTDGVLHASDVPSETLIGGSWPCRLFEVGGEVVAGPDEQRKCGFFALYVEREIEAWRALGPNGREVAAFVGRLTALDDAARYAARDAARDAAGDAARDAAGYAAWYAARALVVRDLISADHFTALYSPFADAIPVESLGSWESMRGGEAQR